MSVIFHVHVGDRETVLDVWEESKHPRGQPENAGEFAEVGTSAPSVGTPTVVFRAGNRPILTNRNAGSAYAVAQHLQQRQDVFGPKAGEVPEFIHAHEVTLHEPAGKYEYLNGASGTEHNVGHMASGAMSFGSAGYTDKLLTSVPTSEVLDWLKEHGVYDFDDAGWLLGARAIREVMANHGVAFHSGGATFASPSVTDLDLPGATKALSGKRQAAFEEAARDVDNALGIEEPNEDAVVGAWADGAENSTMMYSPSASLEQLRVSAAMKGLLGNQKAVLVFHNDPAGLKLLYHAYVPGDLATIHRELLACGIVNHTLAPAGNGADVYVADLDGSAGPGLSEFATKRGVKFRGEHGTGEFIGAENYDGTTDAEQRAEGAAAFERTIAGSKLAGLGGSAAEVWGRLRDRWAGKIAGTQDRRVVVLVGSRDEAAWLHEGRKPTGPEGGQWTKGGGGGGAAGATQARKGGVVLHIHRGETPAGEPPVGAAGHAAKPALTGSRGHPATISSRVVTAKRSTVNSQATYTQTGLEAMKQDPASFRASMELLKNPTMYPYFRQLHGHPDEIAEQALGQMVSNIKYVYANAPPLTRQFGREWYRQENKAAQREAARTGLPLASVAGAYAALSPQRDWNMNVFLSEAVIHAVMEEEKTPWSDAMSQTGERIAQTTALKALLARIGGKTLGELQLPAEKALWIRTWEQSRTPEQRYYRLFRPDGKLGDWARNNDGTKATPTWGSIAQIANAIKSVESGGDREIISEAMGDANKVRSFYNNILDPDSPNGDITADTHAIGVSFLDAIGGSTAPVMHGLGTSPEAAKHPPGWKAAPSPAGTGVKGLYGLHAEAYRRAAKDLGVLPDEVQSLVWEAKRGLFEHMPAGAKAAIHKTWESFHKGEIEFPQAQAQVVAQAGGWKEPDWVREPRD